MHSASASPFVFLFLPPCFHPTCQNHTQHSHIASMTTHVTHVTIWHTSDSVIPACYSSNDSEWPCRMVYVQILCVALVHSLSPGLSFILWILLLTIFLNLSCFIEAISSSVNSSLHLNIFLYLKYPLIFNWELFLSANTFLTNSLSFLWRIVHKYINLLPIRINLTVSEEVSR